MTRWLLTLMTKWWLGLRTRFEILSTKRSHVSMSVLDKLAHSLATPSRNKFESREEIDTMTKGPSHSQKDHFFSAQSEREANCSIFQDFLLGYEFSLLTSDGLDFKDVEFVALFALPQ